MIVILYNIKDGLMLNFRRKIDEVLSYLHNMTCHIVLDASVICCYNLHTTCGHFKRLFITR